MRLNVYAEELRPDRAAEVVHQQVRDEPGIAYNGVRIYLGPDVFHRPGDDDTGAVTFWVGVGDDGWPDTIPLRRVLNDALYSLDGITHG